MFTNMIVKLCLNVSNAYIHYFGSGVSIWILQTEVQFYSLLGWYLFLCGNLNTNVANFIDMLRIIIDFVTVSYSLLNSVQIY